MALSLLRRRLAGLALLLGLAAGLAPAAAQEIPLLAPKQDFLLLDPVEPPSGQQPPSYSSTGPGARWSVAQWNNPDGRLPPWRREREGDAEVFTSVGPHSAIQIRRETDGTVVRLRQDGAVLPCLLPGGQPRESDLFFQANGEPIVPDGRSALLLDGPENPPLSRLAAVTQRVTLTVEHSVTRGADGCTVNQASAIVALVLKNAARQQVLFYQLQLAPFCGEGPPERLQLCRARPDRFVPFFGSHPFGVDDYLHLLGEPTLRSGETRRIEVDVLPRLLEVLRSGPDTIDRDPANWVVGGLYAGQMMWGGVVTRSEWSDFALTITPR